MPFVANADLDDAWTYFNAHKGSSSMNRQDMEVVCSEFRYTRGRSRRNRVLIDQLCNVAADADPVPATMADKIPAREVLPRHVAT